MIPKNEQTVQNPGAWHGSLCFLGIIVLIGTGLFWLEVSLHSLLFLCLIWAGANARWLGYDYRNIRQFMGQAIQRALPAIYIFLLIGMVIASFMHSGTIATLMYYGLAWLPAALFLPIGLLLCSIMSVATGTSWGTVGTLGIVFIGIGEAIGLPSGLVAGMVVCGATFGDKLSPISDTTNLAAMSAETDLYRHITTMLYTTVPTYLLALLIFTVLGVTTVNTGFSGTAIDEIRTALSTEYRLNPLLCLLPILTLAYLSYRRIAPEVTMAASVVVAIIVALIYQDGSLAEILNALWLNSPGNTGIASLDDLLGRGGMYAMSWTLILAIMALSLGGIMHGAGFLKAMLSGLISRVRRTSALIATTISTGVLGNMAMGEAYISIILNCQLFRDKYQAQKLDAAVLSRTVEEGSTMTTGLIPWTTAGAFYSATLGVAVLDYLPYAFFNYLNAVVAVAMAALGLGLLRK